MCLVKMKVEREDEEISEPPRRIIVRPISPAEISQRNSALLVARSPSHSRHSPRTSATRIIIDPPQSRPVVEYVSRGGPLGPGPRASIPRIIHAQPSPEGGSPRGSRVSVHSSSRSPHRHSPRGSRTSVTYVEQDVVERIVSNTRERPRSGHFLTPTPTRSGEVIDSYGRVDTPRATALYLEENPGRIRSRSITYATTGPRLSRERIVVEEGGRRKETYRTLGSI